MKTVIDIDDDMLQEAAKQLGTRTKKETVNAALAFIVERNRRIEELRDDPVSLGVGSDISDPDVMAAARR